MGIKWTSAQRKRFIATMAAKRKTKAKEDKGIKRDATKTLAGTNYHDAIIYLRHAEREIGEQLTSGRIKKLDSSQLYTLLALNSLQGKS